MARYDGLAGWYDEYVSGASAALTSLAQDTMARLAGSGPGRCLDLGCGTGTHIPRLAELGWQVTGMDISADQLAIAHARTSHLADEFVRADAANLPFEDGSFAAVVSLFTHTDVDDLGAVFAEVARVLTPAGRFAYVGTHPCFVSPFVEHDGNGRILHPGYRDAAWHHDGPGIGTGVRSRVGVRHVPLAGLLGAVLDAGLTLEHVEEPGDDDPPILLAFTARSPATERKIRR